MKISVKLDKRYRLSNGKYSVKLSISRNGKTLYIPLGIEIKEEDWDATGRNQNYVKNVKERVALNMYIRGRLSQAEQTIRDLQLKGLLRQFDNKKLIEYLSMDRSNLEKKQFLSYQAEYCLKEKTNKDTIDTYNNALKALSRHYDYDSFLLQDFTKKMLEEFRKKLKEEGLKNNTIIGYIIKLKAIYNFAYDNGDVTTPFPRIAIKRDTTKKRSLLVEQLRALINCKATKIQRTYIDILLLITYMRGINMKDLSELMLSDLRNGRIEYNRDKTGKHIEIKVEPEIMEIIQKYKGKEHLLRFFDGHRPSEEYHKRFGNKMRMSIRNAAIKANITEPISAYWGRHTWSSLAIEIGIDIAYVSAGLSHSHGEPVTQVYIQYRQKKIDEDSRRVIDYILEKGEFKRES
ncbi:Site-specific recombinase XerD [Prevotella sp. tc2-28]|uniref:phage integrase SAM-like domain-containing protein n=1 Tax=Prevotella sp. tc2-28 TaxID=1761888 RepID=UPI000897886C|nr:phage integrase SAM-like domain-containing protein [Prevotella sp. tc2-28]SEA81319.1 Site-specific recombinase XerD [Prevotella sp. tc2-28]